MPRLSRNTEPSGVAAQDVLEVVHHEVPATAAGAGAASIPAPRTGAADAAPAEATTAKPEAKADAETAASKPAKPLTLVGTGMTWRAMLRAVAVTETVGMVALLAAATLYGMSFFAPLAVAAGLFAGAAVWLPRLSKAGAVYSLVVCALTLVTFGGMFFGWTGFLYPTSWFEMTFATLTVLVPVAGITAAVATLRHRNGTDAAKTPARVAAALSAAVVLTGLVGTATADSAAMLPGDLRLTASNFAFEQKALTAKAGNVAIYFDNADPFAHNVEIEGHGTSKDAAGRRAVRHVFRDLAAGTYTYVCALHPAMKGTLTVT